MKYLANNPILVFCLLFLVFPCMSCDLFDGTVSDPGIPGHMDFDVLKTSEDFGAGACIKEGGITLEVDYYLWPDGEETSNFVQVKKSQNAGGTGKELEIDESILIWKIEPGNYSISLNVFNGAGDGRIEVNGEHVYFKKIADIPGPALGGVTISSPSSGQNHEVLKLEGQIESFSLGGKSMWIDVIRVLPATSTE